ncbi:hypothetical protein Pst134EB_002040 [Puccinia striiformis f. sp. tritici]|nr:hypothetical protein Pst134EB_002040 [Puccinia striiformis f. sp. tritici]
MSERGKKNPSSSLSYDLTQNLINIRFTFSPSLERTTDGEGKIESLNYRNGIDCFRTLETPHQKIPTFDETLELLMLKDNQHVILNVDCKPNNDPARLFKLIKTSIDRYAAHETSLNGRIILGIWHPKFIQASVEILPDLKKVYIGTSPSTARKYFWESCSGFSMKFSCLVGFEGQKFRQDCIKYHKSLFVWTVNDRLEMIEASKWGVDAILTDKTADYLELRRQMKDDWEAITAETSILFPYRSIHYNGLVSWLWGTIDSYSLFYYLNRLDQLDLSIRSLLNKQIISPRNIDISILLRMSFCISQFSVSLPVNKSINLAIIQKKKKKE